MRKNKKSYERLRLYSVYTVTGLNLDRFIDRVKNSGVTLYDVKKTGRKKLKVSVNYADGEKFFAISRDLCYNVKKDGEKGLLKFGLFLLKNVGVAVGAVIFTLFSFFADDFIYGVEYYGSGETYYRVAQTYLQANGAEKFSRFSSLDLAKLSDGLAAASDKFSFAECRKCGNLLRVDLVKAEEKGKTLSGDAERLISDVNGRIVSLSVYRGTALKAVGEEVLVGDILADGYATVRDKTVKVGVIAVAVIDARYEISYYSERSGEEDTFTVFAEQSAGDKHITGSEVKVVPSGNGFSYEVTVTYRRILYSG